MVCLHENCSDITILRNYLKNIFEHSNFDQDGKMNYKQSVTTDVTILIKMHSINSRWIHSDCNWNDIGLVPSPFYKGLTSFLHYEIQNQTTFNCFLTIFFFFLIRIHSMQGWTATTRHGVTRKRSAKRLEHTRNLFGKKRYLSILDLKPIRS